MEIFDKRINNINVLITNGTEPDFNTAYNSDIWIDDGKVVINMTTYNIVDGMMANDVIEIIDIRKQRLKKLKKLLK